MPTLRRIFYSWQSDTPNNMGRSLIQNGLEGALKRIGNDQSAEVQPVLDRDTSGTSGSPDITDTILAKIALSDVFVADVTIVNRCKGRSFLGIPIEDRSGSTRPTPNPNVLLELGYAITHLGWNRIILVQNLAFGSPEELPFDLRGRRVLTFNARKEAGVTAQRDRKELSRHLETALKAALALLEPTWRAPERWEPRWWGYWARQGHGPMYGGTLFIREVGSKSFFFHMWVFNGTHTGNIRGTAELAGPYVAEAWISAGDGETPCHLQFRQNPKDPGLLSVTESPECRHFHGMGGWFDGIFRRRNESLYELGYFNEVELQRLYSITGQFFHPLMERFGSIGKIEVLDKFVAEAFSGSVRGTGNSMQGIVMKGAYGQLWAAYTDGDFIRYFTTESGSKTTLPLTIAKWREVAPEKQIIFDSKVQVTPEDL
jgi:hypothetical protein